MIGRVAVDMYQHLCKVYNFVLLSKRRQHCMCIANIFLECWVENICNFWDFAHISSARESLLVTTTENIIKSVTRMYAL